MLNATFYRADPAEYLDLRLWALMCIIGTPDDGMSPPDRLTFEGMTIRQDGIENSERERFAALEATVLLHHAYETLLRLYLAHSNRNPCPWLAIVELRRPGAFPKAVRSFLRDLDNPERVADLLRVASFTSDAAAFNPDMPAELWDENREALVALFRHASTVVLDDAAYYNSAKHGLAVLAGPQGLRVSADADGTAVLDQNGPAIEILDRDPKTQEWRKTTKWVQVAAQAETVLVVVRTVRSLWSVAQSRYTGKGDATLVKLLRKEPVLDLLTRNRPASGLLTMSWSLAHLPS